jgi:hypothetical protein
LASRTLAFTSESGPDHHAVIVANDLGSLRKSLDKIYMVAALLEGLHALINASVARTAAAAEGLRGSTCEICLEALVIF